MFLPEGFSARLKLGNVEIFHQGHSGTQGDLIFSGGDMNHRRPNNNWWSDSLTSQEEQVITHVLKTGWDYDF